MTFETTAVSTGTRGESSRSAVAWPAILAGSFAAAAASVVLLVLGSALGLASSPWARTGTSAAAFGVGAAIWLIVTQWIASGVGGYLAGRLRTKWVGVHDHEVFFRDTAHGFITWAVATVVTAVVLASSLSSLVGAGTQAASTVAAGVAHGAAGAASQVLDPNAYFVDRLFRSASGAAAPAASAPPPATGDSAPAATTDGGNATAAAPTAAPEASASAPTGGAAVRLEGSRLLLHGLAAGKLEPDDRNYLAQLVARQAGIPQADAEKRVDDVVTQALAAEAQVKNTADAARRAAAKFSLYFCLSLLVGAFIASVAAAHGGNERDEYEALLLIDEPLRHVR